MSAFTQLVNVEGYALLFAGQATPWRATLQELLTPELRKELAGIVTQVDKQLEPVANELIVIHPRNVDYFDTSTSQPTSADDADAFVSLTGILLAQFATYTTFKQMFNSQSSPVSVQGHSQGILARELVNASDANVLQAFVVAKLIGAAASRVTLDLGIQANKSATPMLSVKGANQSTVERVLSSVAASGALQHPVSIAVKNDVTHFIISGAPQDLQSVEAAFARAMLKSAELLDKKLTGGTKLEVVTEYLDVTVPFHSQLLSPAVALVSRWASQIGLDQAFATKYARSILVEPVDWVSAVQNALNSGAKLLVDLGPGQVITRMSQNQLQGTATALVNAGTIADLAKLNQPGTELNYSTSWDKFAPELADLPNGQRVVQTAFTKLTGRSPILLAGMTPTTVEPEIVAAATNAGYWVEMAGGGQVTAEVFNKNLSGLKQLLKPGRTVAFNSMFLDRYLWNLQFGGAKIVSRARQSGAPIDGVVITAGIPEFDEAVELIETLNAEGFPFVALKPGTVKQINDVIRIAKESSNFKIIMQVEDGHAGGHHSWENLDDLLLATYAAIRQVENVVLVVGGGIGVPERAADYISGQWSQKYGKLPMPVDGVLIGTAAMTVKEAHTTPEVKQVLRDTQGIPIDDQGGWVGSTQSKGGMTSSLSHLRADIYEIDNDSAAAARLILEVNDDSDMLVSRRDEIVTTLNKTAKPYFGDIEDMTYEQVLRRFVQLCFEGVETDEIEESLVDRFFDLLRRAEARNIHLQVGEFPSIFPDLKSVTNFNSAIDELKHHYPKVNDNKVIPIDLAYFIDVCRKHPKPVPFVPVLDNDLFKWWGSDSLWQSHDKRYKASSCRIIPGPVSVAGIDRIDEPVADLLGRFESAVVQRLEQQNAQNNVQTSIQPVNTFSRIVSSDPVSFIRAIKHISWTGHLIDNPAYFLNDDQYELVKISEMSYDLVVKLDTYWDNTQNPTQFHAVRELVIPLDITADCFTGGTPVVNEQRLPNSMFAMLAATAGVGSVMHSGDLVEGLPQMVTVDQNVIGGVQFNHPNFGRAKFSFNAPISLGHDHAYVTGATLNSSGNSGNSSTSGTDFAISDYVPDALLGTCWPPIYAALGSATITLNSVAGYPVIEGLLNAVHLDHTVDMVTDLSSIIGKKLNAYAWAEDLQESQSGRIVDVRVVVTIDNGSNSPESEPLAIRFRERFAIQGRAYGNEIPANPEEAGGKLEIGQILPTKRRLLRVAKVVAPQDMTAFARVSGDYNPIHTSTNAARVAGLAGPIVHGMWLSAVAQHLVQANYNNELGYKIAGWTVQWYSPTDLNDEVELTLERTGKIRGGGLILEVVAKINGVLTARFTATTLPRPTAYCFPGQGIQQQGMALDEMQTSPAAKAVWERADRHTRKVLGFSILTIVRDNPKEVVANGNRYYHPDGLLNLTQFTQVSLAVVGFAQTSRLRESGSAVENGYFAGHSLGEYVALSSYGRAIDLETVIELVFARGSAMHSLVPRDASGRSNYLMGALRPNQFGVSDANVKDYVASVAAASGEFLEIVNYNLSGQQYAVAGTIAGLKALQADSSRKVKEFGGKGAFMYVPGIDVPFHSSVLRDGVPEFRDKLMKLLPQHIDYTALEQRYIPNLVARPFEFSVEFARAILEVVPSEPIQDVVANWESYIQDRDRLGRILFVELLCWQFASPVRWIETQTLLFSEASSGGLNVKHFVEIGLKNSPTLANLAAKTLQMPEFANANVLVHNIQRDEGRVYYEDDDPAVILEDDDDVAEVAETSSEALSGETPSSAPTPTSTPAPVAAAAPVGSGGTTEDLTFNASDAIAVLFAYSNKLLLEQIGANDTAETLTNGVSSRRNQLLMDMSAELGLASIDSAAEAPVSQLYATVDKVAHNYKPFGPVLGDLVRTNIRKLFGSAGSKQAQIASRISSAWGLGEGWVNFATAEILLSTREGASMRGGDLATLAPVAPKSAGEVDALIDAAVSAVAARKGVAVAMQSAGGGAGGAMVDSEALNAFKDTITGEKGILATTARQVLQQLSLAEVTEVTADETAISNQAVVDAVTAELGQDWFTRVQPAFSEKKVVYLDDRWASAREDLAHLYVNGTFEKAHHKSAAANEFNFFGAGQAVADQANYWRERSQERGRNDLAEKFTQIAGQAAQNVGANNSNTQYINDIAVVTGATPNSIAGAIAAKLLEGSATVVITASNINSARLDYVKDLYRRHATVAAKLYLVPANLSSYRDVDAFINWLGSEQKETVGGKAKLIKPALEPTLLFPFAAPRVMGSLADAGSEAEMETRLLLWSVERMMAGLSVIGTATNVARKLHVVLPGSPNRGIFGGDGAYGEVKAAFDAIVKRWHVEKRWAKNVTLAHPLIGWVRGTSLMGGNDPMVSAVESKGIRTYSTPEIADELLALCTPEARIQAATTPVEADLTGGLGNTALDLAALKAEVKASMMAAANSDASTATGEVANSTPDKNLDKNPQVYNTALPSHTDVTLPAYDSKLWTNVDMDLKDMRVIVGIGEVGPWGSGRTRFDAEGSIQTDGSVNLSPVAVIELAWMMGLLHWSDTPTAGWYDADGTLVPEGEIVAKYRDEVVARCGVREYVDDDLAWIQDLATEQDVAIFLDRNITFTVPTQGAAQAFKSIDPEKTVIYEDEDGGEWIVTKLKGAKARVPRKATMTRRVGGQLPTDFDPAKWGIPANMIESVDRLAIWNLVATVDAFLSGGFTPAELLKYVHPSDVGSTQGTGIGGTDSMRKLFVDGFLGEDRPTDILQEALPNVIAAHVMQSYVGGYGVMVHPVGACATAAVSIEDAVDKIDCGKADFVVAGAIDDISIESITGFGDMNATAKTQDLLDKGINKRFVSRANDRRRAGFVESEGGGTVLVTRGDIALKMGLPVFGVIGYARSFADGAHTSIPAPGLGALGAARGGRNSKLVQQLAKLGVTPDDVAVISKHDTSTNANDPNESELYTRLFAAIGRTQGNPAFVISQKTVTGHAKGGAAVFQVNGLTQLFKSGRIPANRALDCVGDEFKGHDPIVWLREPLDLGAVQTIKAGMVTSLGFGHVAGLIAVVNPGAFFSAVASTAGADELDRYLTRANERRQLGNSQFTRCLMGKKSLFEPVANRRFADQSTSYDPHEVEASLLLNPNGKLGESDMY